MAVFQIVNRLGRGAIRERIRQNRGHIPAEPRGGGGQCTAESALIAGDIIGSTTDAGVSQAIRYWTFSDISHIMIYMIYVGRGKVVEAIDEGVVERSLDAALRDAVVGVTYRHPGITPERQELIRNFLIQRSDGSRGYDLTGAVRAGLPNLPGRGGREEEPTDYFCSQLLFAAYQHAGLPLGGIQPSRATPQNVIDLFNRGILEYVGHVRA